MTQPPNSCSQVCNEVNNTISENLTGFPLGVIYKEVALAVLQFVKQQYDSSH